MKKCEMCNKERENLIKVNTEEREIEVCEECKLYLEKTNEYLKKQDKLYEIVIITNSLLKEAIRLENEIEKIIKQTEYYTSVVNIEEENTSIIDMAIYNKMEDKVLELSDINTKIQEIDKILNKYQSREDKLQEEMELLNNEIEEIKKSIL